MKQVQSRPETKLVSATSGIEAQYSRGIYARASPMRSGAAGKDLDHLSTNDLGP